MRAAMDFEPFGLNDWLTEHEHRVRHMLASSGFASVGTAELGVDLKALEGELGYGTLPVEPRLLSAIARACAMPEERTLATLAGSEADLLAFLAAVKPGDKVVVENPTYPPLRAVPKALGCRVRLHQRTWTNKFRLDLGKLDEQLKGARLFVMSNVNNPTGVGATERELQELHAIAARRRCMVLVDEAFREASFRPLPQAASLGERFASTGTLTKVYGLAGLRVGWLLGPKAFVDRARLAKQHTSLGLARLEQRIALAALEQRDQLVARAHRIRDANFAVLQPWMARHRQLRWVEPDGGPICFPKLPAGTDDHAFALRLVREHGTLVAPGRFQGMEGHVRLGWGQAPGVLEPGLQALDAVLAGP